MVAPFTHNLRDPTNSILHALERVKEEGVENFQKMLAQEKPTVRVSIGDQTVHIQIFDKKFEKSFHELKNRTCKDHTKESKALLKKFFKAVKNNKAAYKLEELTGHREKAYFCTNEEEIQRLRTDKPHRTYITLSSQSQEAITNAANQFLVEINSLSPSAVVEHKKEEPTSPGLSLRTYSPSIKLAVTAEKSISKTKDKVLSVLTTGKDDSSKKGRTKEVMEEEQAHLKESQERLKEARSSEKRMIRQDIDAEHQTRRLESAKPINKKLS